MGSETENSSDEKFVIMGSREYCRVQRYDNFTGYTTLSGPGARLMIHTCHGLPTRGPVYFVVGVFPCYQREINE
jgi:hypothetical protein